MNKSGFLNFQEFSSLSLEQHFVGYFFSTTAGRMGILNFTTNFESSKIEDSLYTCLFSTFCSVAYIIIWSLVARIHATQTPHTPTRGQDCKLSSLAGPHTYIQNKAASLMFLLGCDIKEYVWN